MSADRGPTRVGWGFDAHPLNDEPPLVLGGTVVSSEIGVEATSDGDVVAHALADAVLGACVLGDMGEHFPSGDPQWDNVSSLFLLRQVATMALASGWRVAHADVTVVLQAARVAPLREEMRVLVADALGTEKDSLSIKATTTDGLGFVGRGEGVAAMAVVTVEAARVT